MHRQFLQLEEHEQPEEHPEHAKNETKEKQLMAIDARKCDRMKIREKKISFAGGNGGRKEESSENQ